MPVRMRNREDAMMREASCACGNLRVRCTGEPVLVSMCHCISCQKRTGTPIGIGAFYQRAQVEVAGPYQDYHRASDSGFGIDFHFCGNCGSTVFWEPLRKPDVIAVGVGAFGDPGFSPPDKEVYTECRHDWVEPL